MTNERGNAFDLLRQVAAWMVLVSHHHSFWGQPEPPVLGSTLGGLGLGIFFSMSGYLVTCSLLDDHHLGRFMWRRVLRILPAYTVMVLVCALVLGSLVTTLPLADYLTRAATWDYVRDNLLYAPRYELPGVWETPPLARAVNGSIWSLPFEVAAYLFMAVAALCPRRWLLPLLAVLLLVLLGVWMAWKPGGAQVVWNSDLRHAAPLLFLFAAGGVLACVGARHIGWLALASVLAYGVNGSPLLLPVLAAAVIVCCTLALGRRSPPAWARVRHDTSYGVYLWAFPMQQVSVRMAPQLGFWGSMALAVLLTALMAQLSWRFVERPTLRLKPRRPGAHDPV